MSSTGHGFLELLLCRDFAERESSPNDQGLPLLLIFQTKSLDATPLRHLIDLK